MGDGVPFVEWTGELRLHARLRWRVGAVAKASLNRAHEVCGRRPETKWSTHVQVEGAVKRTGGPNQGTLKSAWMRCG